MKPGIDSQKSKSRKRAALLSVPADAGSSIPPGTTENPLKFSGFFVYLQNINSDVMKRIIGAIILAFSTLTLAAQEEIKVNFQGGSPTISDFAWAVMTAYDDEEEADTNESMNALKQAWIRNRDGLPQEEGVTLTIDQKNGFVLYESRQDESLIRIELCYWNESDKKHKLIACNIACFLDGRYEAGQYDGLQFYRYDNVTKKMIYWNENVGFNTPIIDEKTLAYISYALPRTGKDIVATVWADSGKQQKTLKWNGRSFSY